MVGMDTVLDTNSFTSPFAMRSDGWKHEAALKTARQIKEYWAKKDAPWVRASVVRVADNTYVVRSNLVNGKPPVNPSWR